MKFKRTRITWALVAVTACSCALEEQSWETETSEPEWDGKADYGAMLPADVTMEARATVRAANETTLDQLRSVSWLFAEDIPAFEAWYRFRDGDDGVRGSADDRICSSLSQMRARLHQPAQRANAVFSVFRAHGMRAGFEECRAPWASAAALDRRLGARSSVSLGAYAIDVRRREETGTCRGEWQPGSLADVECRTHPFSSDTQCTAADLAGTIALERVGRFGYRLVLRADSGLEAVCISGGFPDDLTRCSWFEQRLPDGTTRKLSLADAGPAAILGRWSDSCLVLSTESRGVQLRLYRPDL